MMRKRMQTTCTRREDKDDLYEISGEEDPAAD